MSKQKQKKATPEDARTALLHGGSIHAAEQALVTAFKLTSKEQAEDLVGDAAVELVAGAPAELRGSFEMVIAWNRWNSIYVRATRVLDYDTAMKAQKGMDQLLKQVH